MKRLRFHYSMKLLFDDTVKNHHFTLKCVPESNERQKIVHVHTDVYPNEFLSHDHDSFGNACIYGYTSEEHHSFYFDVVGEAETGLKRYETCGAPEKTGVFRYQTPLTKPGKHLLDYHQFLMEELAHTDEEWIESPAGRDLIVQAGGKILNTDSFSGTEGEKRQTERHPSANPDADGVKTESTALPENEEILIDEDPVSSKDTIEWAYENSEAQKEPGGAGNYRDAMKPEDGLLLEHCVEMMHVLHRDFHYEHGRTGIGTTAEEAWKGGCGVCQDYAHIMLSLLRIDRIPCRYITGMLIGTGSSHAWVDVACGGKWYALDPTNDLVVGDEHIRIGCGRDAHDCLINQGIFTGTARQKQMIQVMVNELPYETEGELM